MDVTNKPSGVKTSRPKAGTWKSVLVNMPAHLYFESCNTIADFNYMDFLRFSEKQRLTKDQCEAQWDEALEHLSVSNHNGLRKQAAFLKKQWKNNAHADEAAIFWSKIKRKRGLDKGTLDVQSAVDSFWNKRIRNEYEQEIDRLPDQTNESLAGPSNTLLRLPLRSDLVERSSGVTVEGTKFKHLNVGAEYQAREMRKPRVGQMAPEEQSLPDSPELSPLSRSASRTPSCSSSLPPPTHDMGRSSSLSSDSSLESKMLLDPATFTIHKYILNEHNVGQMFHRYQVAVAKTVNNYDVSATLKNIPYFLAMNYIFTTTEELEGIPTEMMEDIRKRFVWDASRLDQRTVELCGRLDQQLALGDDIHDDTEEPELRCIVVLYQLVALKLPVDFGLFDNGLEDTYCHQVIDALFAYQFPARSRKYFVDWANGEALGSKKRRGHGYRPDGVIMRNGRQISFLEVKPPGGSHTVKEYLHDYWNLANCAKDAIDDYLRQGLPITKVAAIQLFKHRLSLYTMEYVNGLYHWSLSCAAYIPRDQQDAGLASCIRLLNTLEMFLDTINTNLLPRTPPKIDYDDESIQPDCGRPSKITPTKRRNMF